MSILSDRITSIKPSPTLAAVNKAIELKAKGLDVISLGAGEPDFDTPQHIKDAAIAAINAGYTKYTAVDGIKELKQAIVNKFKRDNNIDYDLSEISVGTGAKQVLYNAIMAVISKGDEVIIPAPYWVSYPDITMLAEGTPVFVETKEENNFLMTPEELKSAITSKSKLLILNSPSNPSGACYSADDLKALAKVLENHPNLLILCDDIYEKLVYDGFKFVTLAEIAPNLKNRIITLNGVSKSHSMTGWRIGYCGAPKEIIKAISTIQSQSTSNPSSISQYAALAALNGPEDFLADFLKSFKARRDLVVNKLNQIKGISCLTPQGAFYVFPNCSKLFGLKTPSGQVLNNSSDVADYLLSEALVSVVPGSAFGSEGFFRISYATSERILETACEKIKEAVEKLS